MEAVRLVKGRQAVFVTAKILGIPKASLDTWVKLSAKGLLLDAGDKPVSPKQMELARLCAELARVKMKCDILKKSDGVPCKAICVKYAWIASFKTRWPIALACDVLGVSASSYFEHLRRETLDKPAKFGVVPTAPRTGPCL